MGLPEIFINLPDKNIQVPSSGKILHLCSRQQNFIYLRDLPETHYLISEQYFTWERITQLRQQVISPGIHIR